jgi:hypothetical protein
LQDSAVELDRAALEGLRQLIRADGAGCRTTRLSF